MEHQQIEYKRDWSDEYIKWIAGFANSQGGKIYIGINDKGEVSGLKNAQKLLEEIPNKVKDILGILVDVNLKTKNKLQYLEIKVEAYPYPINYKGQYFFRSGSTKQELKGASLDKFILKKQGVKWDGVPLLNLTIKDLSKSAFKYFKEKAIAANRITTDDAKLKPIALIEKLLLHTDTNYYKRATALLFHPNPEKYVTGAFIKIGFFRTDADLIYQDEVHGTLFEQVEQTMQLLLTKYLKAFISYKGLHRIEKYQIPEPALREAVLNAVVHKDYSGGAPIQISVYEDKLMIWNDGQLPDDWTVARLRTKHPSKPYNPAIANCFFRAGLIESWGRGTIRMMDECRSENIPIPSFSIDATEFFVTFKFSNLSQPTSTSNTKLTGTTADRILQLIEINNTITMVELATSTKVSLSTVERTIKRLQELNKIKRMGSDKLGNWVIQK
ncbi:MAG: hypothetical protein RL065_2191 [Bacteroidota bacterium]